jgi:3-oxoacyl-(acyl-carrier-protein) synthase
MIRAAAWFCAEDCGVYSPRGESWEVHSPPFVASADVPALIGRPVKYYARMTVETRCGLCAASIALKSIGLESGGKEIGLLSAGSNGCLRANEEYFRDYVANGRTLGRGNLFIYTLQTSALGEVAIALSLAGPSMFVQHAVQPVAGMIQTAGQMVSDGEAEIMLGLWSDTDAAVCFVVDGASQSGGAFLQPAEMDAAPLRLCETLRERVRQK